MNSEIKLTPTQPQPLTPAQIVDSLPPETFRKLAELAVDAIEIGVAESNALTITFDGELANSSELREMLGDLNIL
jgi:hypothetical protein